MTEADFDLIENAIRGQLSAGQQEEVQRRRQNDPEFSKAYDDVELMIRAARSVAAERMIREKGNTNARVIALSTPRVLALAATLLTIAMVGIWLYTSKQQDLFNQYYSPYAALSFSQPRGGAELYEIKIKALEAYQAHNTAQALDVLNTAFTMDPADEESLFLAGLCYLEESAFDKAIDSFQKMPEDGDPALQWYRALAYMGSGDHAQARQILKKLEATGSPAYAQKAAELLRKLPEK